MSIREFSKAVREASARGAWIYPTPILIGLYARKVRGNLVPIDASLARSAARSIQKLVEDAGLRHISRGLYVDSRSPSVPARTLEALVDHLRPWDFNYLSLESVLHEADMISQIPQALTVVTTGRERRYETDYGTIEFVHSKRDQKTLAAGVMYDEDRKLHVASPKRALEDLRAVRRNLDLVITGAN